MKKVFAALLMSVISLTAVAEDSKRESVEQLLAVTNTSSMLDGMYSQMDQVFAGMGEQLGVKPSEQEIFDRYVQKMVSAMKEEMSWERMKDPLIDIYLRHYSEKEIQDMLAFYQSESGRSMVDKMPAVMRDSLVLSQEIMKGFFPKLKVISDDLRKEISAKRQGG